MIMLQADRCLRWLAEVFGPSATQDVEERALRFGEESLELIQSLGITREQAEALVKQVFDKPIGEPEQELGGTMVTLATLCAVTGMNAGSAFATEFDRCDNPKVKQKIVTKHLNKAVVSSNFERRRSDPDVPIASIARLGLSNSELAAL